MPASQSTQQQEVIIAGLITTITEVPLSMEHRLRNIEETEDIKRKILSAGSKRCRGGAVVSDVDCGSVGEVEGWLVATGTHGSSTAWRPLPLCLAAMLETPYTLVSCLYPCAAAAHILT